MRSLTRRRSNCSARGGVVAEGTPMAKNAGKMVATATHVKNAEETVLIIFLS